MTMTMSERLVNRVARRTEKFATNRRGFLSGAALVGAALVVDPWSYLTRPASAYATVCGADNTCAAGYTVFCCTINAGYNTCPPDSFIGGWWKADNSSFCGGSARYYIDCNAYRDGTAGMPATAIRPRATSGGLRAINSAMASAIPRSHGPIPARCCAG